MNKNILLMAEVVSNEKEVDREIVFQSLEAALASASREHYGADWDVRVAIDRTTGDYQTFRRWTVVDDEDPEFQSSVHQVLLARAQIEKPDVQPGDIIEKPLESVDFGRIGAQKAKQVIFQRLRDAERARTVELYKDRVGELLTGLIKRLERGAAILDLGSNVEAVVPREHMIPREPVRPGDRLKGYLFEVGPQPRGPQLLMSRTRPEYLIELFKIEVPEIAQGLIEIKGAARDPGLRAKIAVQAKDKRIDPVGACVGMRGSRVQSVSNELAGERIDIVPWNENVAQFVINAMSPAEVESIVVDEEAHAMSIAVAEEKLAQAIGRGGQNVRLASELTGWTLNVMTAEEAEANKEQETESLVKLFQDQLDVDADIAHILVQEGFTSLEEIAYVPEEELHSIAEFDEQVIEELRRRSRDVLLNKALVTAERAAAVKPADDLVALVGDEALAYKLAAAGVVTREDLGDLATDELLEIAPMDEAHAADLIMQARGLAAPSGEQA
ncbi:MAG: transcription termination/antitermination protein NusA [Nevskiaceae bacterium]|nr:MAG: transcription termination/antitermination protein NusA [Nevskiaceae bacterium]TBR73517.1 MAG: transcription termination/antitermination protein NusA [Nevskiaceae bacterium]